MNHSETVKLLALMAAMDRRTVGDAEVMAWQGVLSDVDFEDAAEAVRRHYRESDEYLMPVHVRRGADAVRRAREAAASATPWAPGQYGVLKADAMPEIAGPVDEKALTPEIRGLLASVRAMLPEGSREALMPRRVAWEREHAAYRRTRDAVPNPHYRPRPCDDPDNCFRSDHTHNLNGVDSTWLGEVQCPHCPATMQDFPAHMADYHPGL